MSDGGSAGLTSGGTRPHEGGVEMRLLLTSAGITNTSIRDALVDLLGKPIAESSALCIPNGIQPFRGGPSHVYSDRHQSGRRHRRSRLRGAVEVLYPLAV